MSGEWPRRLLVTTSGSEIIGYTHSSRWRSKTAYDVAAETTVYVRPERRSKGAPTR